MFRGSGGSPGGHETEPYRNRPRRHPTGRLDSEHCRGPRESPQQARFPLRHSRLGDPYLFGQHSLRQPRPHPRRPQQATKHQRPGIAHGRFATINHYEPPTGHTVTFPQLAIWGLYAAAAGRLAAVDTVLDPPRQRLLAAIRSPYIRDGLTCPTCMSFHALWIAVTATHLTTGTLNPPTPILVFAAWAVAQIALNARG